MNFKETVERARQLSFSNSLSSLFSDGREELRKTVDVMGRDVAKVLAQEKIEFQKRDVEPILATLDWISDHLRMSIGINLEVKEFIKAYLQLSFNYINMRRQLGYRSSILEQTIDRLYELTKWRDSEILESLRERIN